MEYNIQKLTQEFHRDGFCLLKQFINPEKLLVWREKFLPLLEDHIQNQGDPSFRGAQRFYVTLPFTAPFADPDIFNNDVVFQLLENLVGKDFVMCQLATD